MRGRLGDTLSDGKGIKYLPKKKLKKKRRQVGSVMGDRDYINRLEQNIMPKNSMSEANFAENSLIRKDKDPLDGRMDDARNYSEYTKHLYRSIDLTN